MIYTLKFSADHKSVTIMKGEEIITQIFSKESLTWYLLHLVQTSDIDRENFLDLNTDCEENELPEFDTEGQPSFKPDEKLLANKDNLIRTIEQWLLS